MPTADRGTPVAEVEAEVEAALPGVRAVGATAPDGAGRAGHDAHHGCHSCPSCHGAHSRAVDPTSTGLPSDAVL